MPRSASSPAHSLARRRASGGGASTSNSSSRRTCPQQRRLQAEANEESGLTFSETVFAPGDVEEDAEDDSEDDEPIDWWAFWRDVDEGEQAPDGLDDDDDLKKPLTAREKIDKMLEELPALRQREDFVSIIPVPTIKEYVRDLPLAQPAPQNPDWGAWDYRSYVEKEKRKARDKAAWQQRMAGVGRYQYLNVTPHNDLRLIDPYHPHKEWSDEETWQFITMNGTAADPRDIVIKVEDPLGRCDILETGGRYIESMEDHLRRTGHWLENEPPAEELDPYVNQLAADFADFEEPGAAASGPLLGSIDEGGAASPAAMQDPAVAEDVQQDPDDFE